MNEELKKSNDLYGKYFLGVDPGSCQIKEQEGQVCFLYYDLTYNFIESSNYDAVRNLYHDFADKIALAVIEEIPSKFGRPYGDFQRHLERLEGNKIPHIASPPSRWQKMLGEHQKKGKVKGIKPSIEYIKARHPKFLDSIRKSKSGFNSNKSDALCLALFARNLTIAEL